MRIKINILILLILPLLSISQPDTNKAYLISSNPSTVIRFFSDGTFIEHSYQKSLGPKESNRPISTIDSGKYSVKRFGIILKGRLPRLLRSVKKDLYKGLTNQKIKKIDASLYPTIKEWNHMEWIRKNHELYIKRSQEIIKNKAIVFVKTYCPEYIILIDSSYCGPGCYNSLNKGKTIMYQGDTIISIPKNINTILHESTHSYNKEDWKFGKEFIHRYMIKPGHDLWAKHTKLYRSSEFINIVPKDAPNRIFRYGSYVGPDSHVSACEWGIYGIMDEFSAYFNGTRADWISYQIAKSKGEKDLMKILEGGCLGTYFAWYEFRTFTGWYLTYAKQNKSDVYKATMENRDIANVFVELDREFGDLVIKIEKEFENSWIKKRYEEDHVKYLRDIMKDLNPILVEFKAEKNPEKEKKIKKK